MPFKKPRGFGNKFKKRKRKKDDLFIPLISTATEEAPVDVELTELIRKLGDEATAKRIRALQALFNGVSSGTVPELIAYDWLQRNSYPFTFQAELYGGRATAGGLLPDFVVETGAGTGMAWQIQGEYWHGKSGDKKVSDAEAAMRLMGQVVGGVRIEQVIFIWEEDTYTKRPQVFQYAIAGIALR